jgi:hypothetical protein
MEWISVKDRFPEDDGDVLVCQHKFGDRYPLINVGYRENDQWDIADTMDGIIHDIDNNQDNWIVTHWMPLPEPPKQ